MLVFLAKIKTTFFSYDETKCICWSTSPTDPILIKNKKILQHFGQLFFFLIYYFLLFEKKKKLI